MPITTSIVLCHTQDTEYNYEGSPALGILTLGSYLEKNGHTVEYYDARVHKLSRFKKLIQGQPAIVGFSVMGGFQITTAQDHSQYVKKYSPGSLVVWGGFFPTIQPKLCFSCSAVDIVIPGEGELALLKILSLHNKRSNFKNIPAIYYKKNNSIYHNTTPPDPISLDSLPLAYTGKGQALLLAFLERGFRRERVGYETSRGCHRHCNYCYSSFFYTHPPRIKTLAKIQQELITLKKNGAQEIELFDDTLLGGDRASIIAFAKITKKLNLSWLANIRLELLDPELLSILEHSGCTWLFIGIDQSSNLALLRHSKINFVFSIVTGLPTQTPEDILKIVKHTQQIHKKFPLAEIQIQSFVPLPGTSACQQALKHGFQLPQTLATWSKYNHFTIRHPWLKDTRLPAKLYLSSFLSYRYQRHFSGSPAAVIFNTFHHIEKLRFGNNLFFIYFELQLYVLGVFLFKINFLIKALINKIFFIITRLHKQPMPDL